MFVVNELANKEEINKVLLNVRICSISNIKDELARSLLTGNRSRQSHFHLIVVQSLVKDRARHICQNLCTEKLDGLFKDRHGIEHVLMHEEGNEPIIMNKLGGTVIEPGSFHDRVQVAMLVHFEANFEPNIKIFEYKLNLVDTLLDE